MTRLPISHSRPVLVLGAGVAGLVAAFELAARGVPTVVVEAADRPGGKMRRAEVGAQSFDAGPTVLTMRWVFEQLFAEAGLNFSDHVPTRAAAILARHTWDRPEPAGNCLDLHADAARSAEAIGQFAGAAEGRCFLRFCAEARSAYRALEHSFIRAQRPSMPGLVRRIGARQPADLLAIRPFETLWHALGRHFRDARLQQLFGRYATYCGSSPFDAPATLMLVAHVEQEGVWLVDSGMFGIANALERLARERGAQFRYGARAERIVIDAKGVCGVELAGGERLPAGAVVANADAAALAQGLLGEAAMAAAPGAHRHARSLSAITWLLHAPVTGFPLLRHNVFFSPDYRAEFADLFRARTVPVHPTIYVCAQDRGADAHVAAAAPGNPERLFFLINAPADGDRADSRIDADQAEVRVFDALQRMGLQVDRHAAPMQRTTPMHFAQSYPGSGGALYGSASHGWRASFQRPGAASKVPGLFLAGGSVHPGPGVPMAALSGRLAVQRILAQR